jgi:hypothetical protein
MAKINWGRVVLGGFLWLVVFNVFWLAAWFLFLGSEWRSAFATLGRQLPETPGGLTLWLFLTLGLGIITIWLYAAIRSHPQYGPGPKTAAGVAVIVWLLSGMGPTLWYAHLFLLPAGLVATSLAVELIAEVVATILGAWLYKEE